MSRAVRGESDWWIDSDRCRDWPDSDAASRGVLDALPDLVYVFDRSGRLVDWNDRFREALGYTDEELAEMDPLTLVAEGDRERAATALSRVANGEEVTVEFHVETADGEEIPHEVTAAPLFEDGEVWALAGSAREISERRERERELSRYKSLLETLGDGVYIVDDDRCVRKVNDAMLEMIGADREDVLGRHISEFTDPETAERGREMSTALKRGAETLTTMECSLLRADGSEIPVEGRFSLVDDEEFATIGLIRDISERRERERELERYETILETVGDGVYVMGDDLRLQEANETLAELFGRDYDEVVGAHLSEFVPTETAEKGIRARRELAERDEKAVATIDGTAFDGDGEEFPIEVRFMPLGGDLASLGLIRDVSDRQERAELLEQVHRGTRELMDAETRQEVAETAAEVSQRHFGFATTGVRLVSEDGDLEPVAFRRDDDRIDDLPPTYAVGEGFVGEAYERGEPVVVDDLQDLDTDFDYDPIRSTLLLPIEGYGMLNIASTEPGAFDESDRELGRLFAADVESAFRRADREEQLRERTEELQRYETLVETMGDGVYMTDENHRVRMVNGMAKRKLGYDPERFVGADARSFGEDNVIAKAREQRAEMLEGERSVGTVEGTLRSADGEEIPVENRFSLLPPDDGEFAGTVGVVRDITDRKESERRLRAQRDELETLNRINGLVQETIGSLTSAATAEEIEETVCDRLGGSSLYRFAFTGVRRPGTGLVEPNAWAGDGAEYLEAVEIPSDPEEEPAGPVARSLESGEVTVVNDLATDPRVEPVREPALEHGFGSVAVIPFTHGSVTHGVLVVFADEAGAFSDRQLTAFEVLGEMVGFAISATQNRRLIESDTPIEMRFELDDPDTFFGAVSAELSCTCRLLGAANHSGDGRLHYVAVSAPPEAVQELAADPSLPDTELLRLVAEHDDNAVFEVRLESSVTTVLFESGAKPIAVEAREGTVTVEATAPRGFDLRGLTDRLDDRFGGVTLAAKRDRESWPETATDACEGLDERLTDRQRAALSAAYFGGYFNWPRDSTAEEVASSLDIASPTFHQHLRHALEKLLATHFDDGPT